MFLEHARVVRSAHLHSPMASDMGDFIDTFDYVGTEVVLMQALGELAKRRLKDPEKKTRVTRLTSEILGIEKQLRAEKRRARDVHDKLQKERRRTWKAYPPEYERDGMTKLAWQKDRLEDELASMKEYYRQLHSDNVTLKSKIKELRDQVSMFVCLQPNRCSQRAELGDAMKAVERKLREANATQRELREAAVAVSDETDALERLRCRHQDHLEALLTENVKREKCASDLVRQSAREFETPMEHDPAFDVQSTLDELRAELELCLRDYSDLLAMTKTGPLTTAEVQTEPVSHRA